MDDDRRYHDIHRGRSWPWSRSRRRSRAWSSWWSLLFSPSFLLLSSNICFQRLLATSHCDIDKGQRHRFVGQWPISPSIYFLAMCAHSFHHHFNNFMFYNFSNFVLLIRYFISALSHLPPPNSWLLIIKPFSITFNPPLRFCHTITSLLIRFLTKQSMFISFISPYGNHDPLASV